MGASPHMEGACSRYDAEGGLGDSQSCHAADGAFAPAEQTRASARPDPTVYWLTRKELQRRFGEVRDVA